MDSLVLRLRPSQKSLLSPEFHKNCEFVGTSSLKKLTEKATNPYHAHTGFKEP